MVKIVKTCQVHGALTENQIRRRKPPRKELICRDCESLRQKKKRSSNILKALQNSLKYRYIERDINTKEMKCSGCQVFKSTESFSKYMFKLRAPYCCDCHKRIQKAKREKPDSKEKARLYAIKTYEYSLKSHLKRKYGLPIEDYKKLLKIQKDVCAICNQPPFQKELRWANSPRLHVDHDHLNGRIRGLLCGNCNQGLGQFKDNLENLKKAVKYLEFHENQK